jgi:RimJ/RimL family protein N-acetyltransferase
MGCGDVRRVGRLDMAALPDVVPADAVELRRSRTSHLAELMAAMQTSRAELTRWLPWADPFPTEDAELAFLRDQERAFDCDESYGYFLFDRESGELVGGIGLHRKDERTAEIGYWVRSDCTGRGFATASAGALTEAAFRFLAAVDRVIIRMDQANYASAAVPRKLGFTLQGEDLSERVPSADRSGKGWLWAYHRPAE